MAQAPVSADREQASTELGRAFKAAMASVRRLRSRDNQRPSGLSHARYSLLIELAEHGELSAGDLACEAALSPATVTEMLDQLAEAGLVVRSRSDRDRRVVSTRLADAGRALVEERHRAITPMWQAALADFSEAELRAAAAVLDRLGEFFETLDERQLP
jgi:DNA-binding MarR family transcriptional regulator